jgi:hypothetical protein
MNEAIIIFKTAGDTIEAERKLIDAGIDARMMDAPKSINAGGNICLAVNPRDIGKVRLLLGDRIGEIFPVGEGGVI